MQFGVLGPLEVVHEGQSVPLGGTKQRAALGYLLLHNNRVAATSELVSALWPVDDAPASARKILQNAVWSLRRLLTRSETDQPEAKTGRVALVTQPPGYKLIVPPDAVDLVQFQARVDQGRRQLTRGGAAEAADTLGQALALWRGPALADLAEADIVWPELSTVENLRLDAQESYFEAQLACGRHQAVLAELETIVNGSALRENTCRQLMLALYRSGRQADALNVYTRVRAALVDELGIEPSRDLQALQLAILAQDPALDMPAPVDAGTAVPSTTLQPATAPAPPAAAAAQPTSTRSEVTVLLVSTQMDGGQHSQQTDGDLVMADVMMRNQECVERLGGQAMATIGHVSMAVFPSFDDSVERAVFAALTIRDGVLARGMPPVRFRAAVVTDTALLRHRSGPGNVLASVTGRVLDRCQELLGNTDDGEIRVCEATRRRTAALYRSHRLEKSGEWLITGAGGEGTIDTEIPLVEREFELSLISELLERARFRATPHLVTILGDTGTGKSRFLTELGRTMESRAVVARYSVNAGQSEGGGFALQRELVLAFCGIQPTDPVERRRWLLEQTLGRFVDDPDRIPTLRRCLLPYLDPAVGPEHPSDLETELAAWRLFLAQVSLDRPLALLIDDLHNADDQVLAMVNGLADFSDVPLLVVASAHPMLLELRPDWGGGLRHAATMTLDPISDVAIDHLLETAAIERPWRGPRHWLRHLLAASGGVQPDERRRHLRSLLGMGAPRCLSVRAQPCITG